jgi:S-(hydroxymethyl)glutathione dehydrogenase/alcohol dehydrogenase
MKAAVLYKKNSEFIIQDVEISEPKYKEVLVKLSSAAICHTDLHAIRGSIPVPFPIILGHEGAGVVEEVGDGVEGISEGDNVVLTFCSSCGECKNCKAGKPTICERGMGVWFLGTMMDGTRRLRKDGRKINHFFAQSSFAEYSIVHESAAVPVREDAPLDKISVFGCGLSTGIGAVLRTANVSPGQNVAVFGCGGVGLSVIMAAKLAGAEKIIAVDLVEEKLKIAQELGATHVLLAKENPVREIQKISGGVDHAFECVGSTKVMEQAFRVTSPGGSTVIIGAAPVGTKIGIDATFLLAEKKIIGTLGGSLQPKKDIPEWIDFYMDGKLPVDKIISNYRLEEINLAFSDLEGGKIIKGVIVY